MTNIDAFWSIIAASYTEDELRYLDSLWWDRIAGVVERVRRYTR